MAKSNVVELVRGIFLSDIKKFFNDLDKTGRNYELKENYVSTMSNERFIEYAKNLFLGKECLWFDINRQSNKITLELLKNVAKKYGIELYQKLIMYNDTDSEGNPKITKYLVPILHICIMRLQQMITKKNKRAHTADKRNQLTGTVTGASKASAITDTQRLSMAVKGADYTIMEMNGARADDQVDKGKMLSDIALTGTTKLEDMANLTSNKQTLRYASVMLTSIGFDVKIKEKEIDETKGGTK